MSLKLNFSRSSLLFTKILVAGVVASLLSAAGAHASTTVEGNPFWQFNRPFDVQCEFQCPLGVNIIERVNYVVRSNGLQFPNDTTQVLFCTGATQTVAHTLPSPLALLTGADLRCFVRFNPLIGVDSVQNEMQSDSDAE